MNIRPAQVSLRARLEKPLTFLKIDHNVVGTIMMSYDGLSVSFEPTTIITLPPAGQPQ